MKSHVLAAVFSVVNFVLLIVLIVGASPREANDPAAPTVVRAQAIELVDAQGKVRGQLYLGADGGGNLRLRAPNGEVRVKIGATNDGSGLMFADNRTEPAVQLHAGGQGGTSLTLTGEGQKVRVISPE